MAATTLLFADNASTTLAASITAAATTCTLAPGTGALFPVPGANQAFPLTFVDSATGLVTEIVKVTGMSGDTVTSMVRGQEGTAARAWLAGDLASNFWTAGALGAGAMAQVGPLQQGAYGYVVDSGSANAVVLTLSPAITSYADGLPINFKAAANNSGATTINVNGVGAVALQGAAGALQGGEIVAGKTYEANYNSTSNTFVLVGQGGGAEQVAPATQSQHAAQLQQVLGKQSLITSSSTFTVPTGVTQIFVTGVAGGGGGGGGGGNTSTSGAAGGGGGGQGQQIIKQVVTVAPGQVLTATIGAAGTSGAGGLNSGTNGGSGGGGGTSSLTGTSPTVSISLTGGSGGSGGTANTGSGISAGGNGGQSGAGVSIGGGEGGKSGVATGGILPGCGGAGGGTVFGSGGFTRTVTTGGTGMNGYGYGAGGSGGTGGANGAAGGGNGGAGAAGAFLIEW